MNRSEPTDDFEPEPTPPEPEPEPEALESSISGTLVSWDRFAAAHHDMIRCSLIALRVPLHNVDDLAHDFLLKMREGDRLAQAPRVRKAFRAWLFTALRNHVYDQHRRRIRDPLQASAGEVEVEAARVEGIARTDAIYALGVLHLALQRLRRECEATGKADIWLIFETLVIEGKFAGREAEKREELRRRFPDRARNLLDNRLTTAKRTLERIIPELIPADLTDAENHADRLDEWKAILQALGRRGDEQLATALRVTPIPSSDITHIDSVRMLVNDDEPAAERAAERSRVEAIAQEFLEPAHEGQAAATDDEFALLLSFRLSLPFHSYLGGDLRLNPRRSGRRAAVESRDARRCLLDLVQPRDDESTIDAGSVGDTLALLRRVKSVAKWTHANPHHALPPEISILIYNLASASALVRFDRRIDSLDAEQLAQNLRWSLNRPWLDDRLRPVFRGALSLVGA
jgi:DNA-directed RNA polymerase specialized sigma24 family protein